MDDQKYLSQLNQVVAPPDFEQSVLTRLKRNREKRVKLRKLEFSLAGATTLIIIGLIIFSPSARKPSSLEESSLIEMAQEASQDQAIHLVEPLDLRQEMRRSNDEIQTVFILEQVSDNWVQQVRY
ncbi:MAG: hypothetical protein PHQ25_01295 [Acidobacteriota bacterium]|nr:hypothetical protein [Acidobacteriota bacterium]